MKPDAMMLGRLHGVEAELADWAKRSPQFDFDPTGTDLFSMVELSLAFAKRADDLAGATRALLSLRRTAAAVILARALIETVAMGVFYVDEMQRLIANGNLERWTARFEKFYGGSKGSKTSPVHVNDALRHLEMKDKDELARLAEKNETLAELAAKLALEGNANLIERAYTKLSEVAHPNALGTHILFPADGGPSFEEGIEDLRFSCEVAIWQCRFLNDALTRSEKLPEAFRRKFMQTSPQR